MTPSLSCRETNPDQQNPDQQNPDEQNPVEPDPLFEPEAPWQIPDFIPFEDYRLPAGGVEHEANSVYPE